MPDFTVHEYGTDSSGRPILMTAYMAAWLEDVKADLDFTPVVVQGAFMARLGGGADASAGYHDLGGCLDFRTRDLSSGQRNALIAACRAHGAAAWRRDQVHGGMDEHAHIVLGTDIPLASGAAQQWRDYVNGYDGLYYSDGRKRPDYEERPDPLVLTPPEDDMPSPKDWTDADWAAVDKHIFGREIGGKDKLTFEQILNKLKTWLGRQ